MAGPATTCSDNASWLPHDGLNCYGRSNVAFSTKTADEPAGGAAQASGSRRNLVGHGLWRECGALSVGRHAGT